MPPIPVKSAASASALTRPLKLLGVMCLSLALPACASTRLTPSVKTVVVETNAPRLKLDERLLAIQPLTARPAVRTNGDLEDWAVITDADHRRDRGQLQQLVGAVRQRDLDQDELDALAAENAKLQADAIKAANEESAVVKRPFWKGLF